MKRLSYLILLFVLLISAAGAAHAQSTSTGTTIQFPRFVASAESDSGLVLFNPNPTVAPVTLSLTDRNGGALLKPVTVSVPAGGQTIAVASQLFGAKGGIDASLELTSPLAGIVAQFQSFDYAGAFMDGTIGSAESLESVFPVIPGTSAGKTEISLLNRNAQDTVVRLRLWGLGGTMIAEAMPRVPARGSIRASLQSIFSTVTDFSAASHIVATSLSKNIFFSPQNFLGTSLFFGDSSDLAALNATPISDTSIAGAIPFFETGATNFSTLSIANIDGSTTTVSLTVVGTGGTSLGTKQIQIPANGGYRQPLDRLFPALSSLKGGWVLLQSSGRVVATLLYGRKDDGALSAVPLQKLPQLAFVFPQIAQGSGFSTRVTLVNPGPLSSIVDISVINSDGSTSTVTRITIPSGAGISQRLDEYMPELNLLSGSVLFVRASAPIFAAAALWMDSGTAVTTIAPQSVPDTYSPEPLTSFEVSGTVSLNGLPIEDISVLLSGPNGVQSMQTGKDGTFTFFGLPKGNYSLYVDQYGFRFVPSPISFEITTASFRQSFQGILSDGGILPVPATIPAKSADTTITIHGSNFTNSSQAFSGTVGLQTTFVSPTELQAVLFEYMLKTAGILDLHVENGTQSSDSFQIVVFVQRPQLDSVTPVRDIIEGSPAATITLNGLGFLDGAKVAINGNADGIAVNRVSDTVLVAQVPPEYFVQGGIYPVTVENPYPATVASNVQLLTVYFPRPALESLSPDIVPERLVDSSGPLTLILSGYGFRRGALVLFEGTLVPTSYCEDTPACATERLTAIVDPGLLRSNGFKKISVKNPDPSVAPSQILLLRVESLQPTITEVLPGSATVLDLPGSNNQYNLPVVIFGTNFDPKAEVRFTPPGGCGSDPCPVVAADEVISSSQLVATAPIYFPSSIGTWTVEVTNPQPGGGLSQPMTFEITQGSFVQNPFIISITPTSVASGSQAFTLKVTGTNFVPGSQVIFYSSPLQTTFVDSTQLVAQVPAALIKTPGKKPITVTNPDNGGTSNKLFIEVN